MKNSTRKFAWACALVANIFVLSACGAAAPSEPTPDPNMVFTQVAETVMVSMTQTAEAQPPTPTSEPTPTPKPNKQPTPTVDLTLPTLATIPTQPLGPTATIQRYGDAAKWNTQSPLDGKVFKVGEEFVFHVCLGNIGSTDWDDKYYLEFVSGNRLWSDTSKFYITDLVKPNGVWCFDLPSVAPYNPGTYITRWYFKNKDGDFILEVYFAYKVEA